MNGWTMGMDGWLWMAAWMLVLIVAVSLLVWVPRRGRDHDEPIDVLRGRLARGEISPEEFERARSLLAASPTIEGKAHR
jgi:uncharacterized membrane protein